MIEVSSLSKVFPARSRNDDPVLALDRVSFSVARNEFFTMIGPSGCGKSTLLRTIAGLAKPTAGQVRVEGTVVEKTTADVVVVWQEFALLDWRTVEANIRFGLEVNGRSKAEQAATAERLMNLVNLSQFRNKYPAELSGGMRQRVGLARALALDPSILLMDEPFGALDAQTRLVMQGEIMRIRDELKNTMVLVTHSLDEAIILSDRVAVFTARPGRIKEIIEIELPRPRRPEIRGTAAFGRVYDHLYGLLKDEVEKSIASEYMEAANQ